MNKKTEIRRPFTFQDSVTIVAPDNYRFSMMPQSVNEMSEFGSFEILFEKVDDNTLHVYRKAVMNKGTYEKATFDRFYEMIQKIKSAEQRKIVLQSKT